MGLKNALNSLAATTTRAAAAMASPAPKIPAKISSLTFISSPGNNAAANYPLVRSASCMDASGSQRRGFYSRVATSGAGASSVNQVASFAAQQRDTRPSVARRIEVEIDELAELVEVARGGGRIRRHGFEDRTPFLVDVRESKDLEMQAMIPGAINIPLSVLKASLALSPEDFYHLYGVEKPDKKNFDVIFYGRGPNAGMTALEIAHKSGYRVSRHFPGGIIAWEKYDKFGLCSLI